MKNIGRKTLICGLLLLGLFAVWTVLVMTCDVKKVGVNETNVGFATVNTWFHNLTGVHMTIYTVTDWLGLVPIFICMVFGFMGLCQLIKRKSLLKVDYDITILGIYYIVVIFAYLIFEMIPINYRPVLIDGFMEASYPSSTTLLVLSVMPTVAFEAKRRIKKEEIMNLVLFVSLAFSIYMVVGRTIAGVHWLSDIIGSIILSLGLYSIYKGCVTMIDLRKADR